MLLIYTHNQQSTTALAIFTILSYCFIYGSIVSAYQINKTPLPVGHTELELQMWLSANARKCEDLLRAVRENCTRITRHPIDYPFTSTKIIVRPFDIYSLNNNTQVERKRYVHPELIKNSSWDTTQYSKGLFEFFEHSKSVRYQLISDFQSDFLKSMTGDDFWLTQPRTPYWMGIGKNATDFLTLHGLYGFFNLTEKATKPNITSAYIYDRQNIHECEALDLAKIYQTNHEEILPAPIVITQKHPANLSMNHILELDCYYHERKNNGCNMNAMSSVLLFLTLAISCCNHFANPNQHALK